jgi:hypothetical protein
MKKNEKNQKETLRETPSSRRVKKGEVVFLSKDETAALKAMKDTEKARQGE